MRKYLLFGHKFSDREKQVDYFIKTSFGIRPKNINLYVQSLTHKSVQTEKLEGDNNERLEFLGDALLSAIVAEILYLKFPKKSEGELTQMRARIVSRENLNSIGEKLGLEPLIDYQKSKNKFNSLLGNAFESIIGALYLDHGYKITRKILRKNIFNELFNFDEVVQQNIDFKSQLIIQCQKNKQDITFEMLEEIQEDNGGVSFVMAILIDGVEKAKAKGATKRKAEQKAAKQILSGLISVSSN